MLRLLYWLLVGWRQEGEGEDPTLYVADALARVRAFAKAQADLSGSPVTKDAFNQVVQFCDDAEVRVLNGEPIDG